MPVMIRNRGQALYKMPDQQFFVMEFMIHEERRYEKFTNEVALSRLRRDSQ
jgi:hypothetical protein